jgi:hypothetical protein
MSDLMKVSCHDCGVKDKEIERLFGEQYNYSGQLDMALSEEKRLIVEVKELRDQLDSLANVVLNIVHSGVLG